MVQRLNIIYQEPVNFLDSGIVNYFTCNGMNKLILSMKLPKNNNPNATYFAVFIFAKKEERIEIMN